MHRCRRLMLVRGRAAAGPLAVVALIKIVTLFTALWAGVAAVMVTGEPLHLGPDAGPSARCSGRDCGCER